MKEFIKKNFAVLLAFILPLLLIIIVTLSIYIPSLFVSTEYNFVYASCSNGTSVYPDDCYTYLQKFYSVVDGKIVKNTVPLNNNYNNPKTTAYFDDKYAAHIFLYDSKKNESKEISFDQAQSLALNDLLTSPDGVMVSSGYNYGGGCDFFFFGGCGGSSYGYYFMKGGNKHKINLVNMDNRYYYNSNFQFLGWVLSPIQN